MKKKSPKHFLLLEVLLSLALLVSLFFPMLKTHFALFVEKGKLIEKMEYERLKEDAFADVITLLYENQIPFQALNEGVSDTLVEPCQVQTASKGIKSVKRNYQILPLELCHKTSTLDNYLLVEIRIQFETKNRLSPSYSKIFLIEELNGLPKTPLHASGEIFKRFL